MRSLATLVGAVGLLAAVSGCAGTTTANGGAAGASGAPASASANGADGSDAETVAALRAALDGAHRPAAQKARDVYRHPVETLGFFGLRRHMTVVELWPGGDAWYTAVLAPVLAEKGKLVVTNFDPQSPNANRAKYAKRFVEKTAAHPEVYKKVEVRVVDPPEKIDLGPEGSADMVLTFRNLHGWITQKIDEKVLAAAFRVLKKGGVFGVVDHRAKPDADPMTAAKDGYLPEAYVIKVVEAASFKLVGKSEVNANPKDTKDHPKGVWTLPPTLTLKDQDRAKYLAIGESDRMTLKFIKP
jgi:predicted methyltransferase